MDLYAERLFPLLHDLAVSSFHRHRSKLVPLATGRVLEIGIGSGMNLPHYVAGQVETVVGIEPSEGMRRRAGARAAGLRMRVEIAAGSAESLPYPDAAFDTVVATLVLCTIADIDAACREAFRVLKPGGRYVTLEHVRSADPRTARWQERLTPIQRIVGVGCHLDRDAAAAMARAGFDLGGVKVGPTRDWAPATLRTLARGVAIRPA